MEMSLEIPIKHLSEFLPLTDFGFGLAHLCLRRYNVEAPMYCKAYRNCLLDNSMYELGDEPLTIVELASAAFMCDPVAIIAPDWMGQRHKTVMAAEALMSERPTSSTWGVGGVVQGSDLEDRMNCYYQLRDLGCRPICFPFRTPRTETIMTLAKRNVFSYTGWYHLLGLHALSEIKVTHAEGRWSYDTSKPFKGKRLDQVDDVRGLGRLQLDAPLSDADHITSLWNIAYLRKIGGSK
jgi:hypothetical protein